MTVRAILTLALIAAPRTAAACAVCLGSAFGDRGFNWAFVALMLTPLAVALALGGILVRALRRRPADDVESVSSTEVHSC